MSDPATESLMTVYVRGIRIEAEGVRSFELWPESLPALPPAEAGAHIDVHLAGGLIRQYSITNPREAQCYVIGVNRDVNSRGGSKYLHETVRVGDRLQVSAPRNHFALDERAGQSVLIAGGIGITPLYAMARRLLAIGRPFVLYYCARSRARAAFFETLRREMSTAPDAVLVPVFDDESGVASLDVRSVVSRHPGAHFYCCGPEPLMQTFVSACEAMEPGRVHIEYFGTPAPTKTVPDAPGSGSKAFSVRLARSNLTLEVRPDTSILDALLERGITVFNSCRQGICGSCETAVLAGNPVHRDRVLSPAERAANTSMMLCVSRCEDDSLVLDL